MPRIFLSHCSSSTRRALVFKKHMISGSPGLEVFLSSDWVSIRSGEIWVSEIETALRECDYFAAILTCPTDSRNLWINYEIGFARGRGLSPKIFLFNTVKPEEVSAPLSSLHLICPGDSNRRAAELEQIGVRDAQTAAKVRAFGDTVYLLAEPIEV
jgi:hypothetical protein